VSTPTPAPLPDADLARMLMIRHFENALLDLFSRGLVNGTTHTCLGQEYVPVAVSGLLEPADLVLSNHRGHGHYLARYDDPAGLLAEIMGRAGALCGGVGGSQHLYRGSFLSTGVQGESLPVAVGVALHLKKTGTGQVAVAYTGDGTWGEGAVYEALNLAALWQVPLLVVVENNGIAQTTPTPAALAGTIGARAEAFGLAHRLVTGSDVAAIRAELAGTVEAVRLRCAPAVVEFDTVRLGPHSKGDDTRPAAEVERLRERDWYAAYRAADPDRFARLDAEQAGRVAAVVADVTGRGPSSGEATWTRLSA
jgi:TPP-dependent pyruvate/acetoin dehydrogenase alpha subunit